MAGVNDQQDVGVGIESFSPQEIARRVEQAVVAKAQTGIVSTLALAGDGRGLRSLGRACWPAPSPLVPEIGTGPTRFLMGLGLAMGLFMVVITGAELFTGNNLMLMGLLSRRIGLRQLGQNWVVVYVGNLVGALIIVSLVYYGRWWAQGDFSFAAEAVESASAKLDLSFETAFLRGILANMLVCLAVWLAMAGRTVADKLQGLALPIITFTAAGFEHSVANMYFVPLGLLVSTEPDAMAAVGLTSEQAARL